MEAILDRCNPVRFSFYAVCDNQMDNWGGILQIQVSQAQQEILHQPLVFQ